MKPRSAGDFYVRHLRSCVKLFHLQKGFITMIKTKILFALVIALISACSDNGEEITSYPMLCEKALVVGKCEANATPLNRETFKVYASSQQVVSWLPGVLETPISLEKCAVRDFQNWKCQLPRNEGEVGFADGEYNEKLYRSRGDNFYYVHAWFWWWQHLVGSRL